MTRVDDVFIKQLVERGEDLEGLWAFSEITEGGCVIDGINQNVCQLIPVVLSIILLKKVYQLLSVVYITQNCLSVRKFESCS
jgi:hypothetical protein